MKIFLDTEAFLGHPSGISFYLMRLYEAILKQGQIEIETGCQTIDLSLIRKWEKSLKEFMPSNTPHLHRLFLPGRFDVQSNCLTRKLLSFKSAKYDLVHLPRNSRPKWLPLDSLANAVITVHDMFNFHSELGLRIDESSKFMLENLIAQLHECRAVLTVSEFSKRDICNISGISPSKVFVTPPSVQWSDIELENASNEPLPVEGDYFLTVGALSPHKNFATLLKAFADYKGREKLVMASSRAPGDDEVVELIKRDSRIVHLSSISNAAMLGVYKKAKGFFLISKMEGFGIPLLEAMKIGCPACYSKGNSMDETGRDGAISVDYNDVDAIRNTFECFSAGGKDIRLMTEKAKIIASEYSWERTAKLTLDVFKMK